VSATLVNVPYTPVVVPVVLPAVAHPAHTEIAPPVERPIVTSIEKSRAVAVARPQPIVHPSSVPEAPVVVAPPELVSAPPLPEAAPIPAAPAEHVAPAPVAPRYSIDTAHVDIGGATVTGATAASVERAITPVKPRVDACYRAALPRLTGPLEGAATLHLETDDVGVIRRASVNGVLLGSEVGPCIAKVVVGRKVANVDTSAASADVPLSYRAR